MAIELPFDPFPPFKGSHKQTIFGSVLHMQKNPASKTKHIILPDGDKLALEMSIPRKWKKTDLTVVMIHGLCGSHRSPYLIRMTKKLQKRGVRVFRFNLRGCGTGKGLAKHSYHGGQSEDIEEALRVLKKETPNSPIILIGFSLGGGLALKLAGELKDKGKNFFKKVLAINPPIDLYSSITLFSKPENKIYERYFSSLLREDVYFRHNLFPDLPPVSLPQNMSLLEFDKLYTVPHYGFKDVMDYYQTCSANKFIPFIEVPCNILLSKDDPIISAESFEKINFAEKTEVFVTQNGGHMGYLGTPGSNGGFHWMDNILLQWIFE